MSIEAMSHVLSSWVGDATSKLVLLAYANHAAKDGSAAWPGKTAVAEYAECDPKTVQRKLRKLEAAGRIRRGDQELVSHLRADRRPVVYDVAMTEPIRLAWKAAWERAAAGEPATPAADDEPIWTYDATSDTFTERGDTLPPRQIDTDQAPVDNDAGRGDTLSTRPEGHGGTPETSRGDTAVSTNPSRTVHLPPSPTADAAGVTGDAATIINTSCAAHPNGALGCRPCGTSPRQLAGAAKRAAAEAARAADRRSQQMQRDQAQARRADPANAAESLKAARAAAEKARAASPHSEKANR